MTFVESEPARLAAPPIASAMAPMSENPLPDGEPIKPGNKALAWTWRVSDQAVDGWETQMASHIRLSDCVALPPEVHLRTN